MSIKPKFPSEDNIRANPIVETGAARRFQKFGVGFILTCIPVGILMVTSAYMTHVPLTQIGIGKLGVAIALPIIVGLLANRYYHSVMNSLEKILEALPF